MHIQQNKMEQLLYVAIVVCIIQRMEVNIVQNNANKENIQ